MNLFLTLAIVYQAKHFLADYIFQMHPYFLGKFKKGWDFFLPLLCHVAVHAVMTLWIVMFASKDIELAWQMALLDGVIHFFMDRIKAGERYMGRWKPITVSEYVLHNAIIHNKESGNVMASEKKLRGNMLFWPALGFDQMVHHLTHYLIIGIVCSR